jgi:hypothetical protein
MGILRPSGAAHSRNLRDYVLLAAWPTPNAGPQNDTDSQWPERRELLKAQHKNGNGFGLTLGMAVQLATWRSPNAGDAEGGVMQMTAAHGRYKLRDQAPLATWGTPNCMDHLPSGNLASRKLKGGCVNLKDQVFGLEPSGSPAATAKRGQLNPAHSRWLMGYPPAWDACAGTAMPSSRKSRPRSSAPISSDDTGVTR